MAVFGIIGNPLSHSFSPDYFSKLFQELKLPYTYERFEIKEINEIFQLILVRDTLLGLNVTMPFKKQVLEICDEVSPLAVRCGAVNTLVIKRMGGRTGISGHNTDYLGFRDSLPKDLSDKKALILGSGGAAQTVAAVFADMGITYSKVSRNAIPPDAINWNCLTKQIVAEHRIIVNTTPLGMQPETDHFPPLPYEAIGKEHFLYDLIYNPPISRFLEKGREMGAQIKNGKEMLELQAMQSWRIWASSHNILKF